MKRSREEIADSIREFMIAMLHAAPQEGLSLSAAAVLGVLYEVGPQRITTLAASNAVTQPAMTALVNRLESTGLVLRVVDPVDSRARLVTITEKGIRTLLERRGRQNAAIAVTIDALDAAQAALLLQLVPTLREMSGRMKS
ncbi:MarR family winged helix-turn-helix transcriptional regulator [Nocardioides bigeumensis]|uniref:HTH marR-type domain-containing protein n=1 Tax=Nocardioides bigeumensis TaxID=433657 RepID=A0ABP5J982_9ACTN